MENEAQGSSRARSRARAAIPNVGSHPDGDRLHRADAFSRGDWGGGLSLHGIVAVGYFVGLAAYAAIRWFGLFPMAD